MCSVPPGESPPPPPRACFGRDELIKKVVGLAETLTPIALIGVGGIGKTTITRTVLHHDRIRERFGDDRRFIRCDQFPASRSHFLSQLSKVIGAGVENPEDLIPLRPFLSSREMIIFLDDAESILDPQGTSAAEIYTAVEELSQFKTICLCITSRISIVPGYGKRLVIPTLSMESACDIFYGICDDGGWSNVISNLLKQLDFHALSIKLLATTASRNMWDYDRLAREWDTHRVQVLRNDYNESLEAAIELSLSSPTFRDLLSAIAFFPQGINENNLDWLFPTISNRRNVLDRFTVLSLTSRNNGFVTMLAPLRDYLFPKEPALSPLIQTAKDHYLTRLSVETNPGDPGFEEARWITSEDVNVEHLLDSFTSIDVHSDDTWDACASFMRHLYWHKMRLVVLGPKIEGLPDDHRSKPHCLFELSRLLQPVRNHTEYKRLLIDTLRLWRERGDDAQVAETLVFLSDTNKWLRLYEEGILQAKEALKVYERLNHTSGQAVSWYQLAPLLYYNNEFDAAKEAALRAIDLHSDEGDKSLVCECYRVLGQVYHSRGETEKAIGQFETALGIASTLSRHDHLFWNNYSLAELFFSENMFDDAHAYVECAKSHAINSSYPLGRAMGLQANFWYKECRFEEAKSEAPRAIDVYKGVGATDGVESCKAILLGIEDEMKTLLVAGEPDLNGAGESLGTVPLPTPVNSILSSGC